MDSALSLSAQEHCRIWNYFSFSPCARPNNQRPPICKSKTRSIVATADRHSLKRTTATGDGIANYLAMTILTGPSPRSCNRGEYNLEYRGYYAAGTFPRSGISSRQVCWRRAPPRKHHGEHTGVRHIEFQQQDLTKDRECYCSFPAKRKP